jgi:hypothetical protein
MQMKWKTFLAYIEAIERNNNAYKEQEKSLEWKQNARKRLGLNG